MKKSELIQYFTQNNKSGYKTREIHVKKNFPELLDDIEKYNETFFSKEKLVFSQKLYHFLYDVKEIPLCEHCGGKMKWRGVFTEGYLKYCSRVCNDKSKHRIMRMKKTNMKRYGVDSVLQNSDIMNKKWETINGKITKKFEELGYIILNSNKIELLIKHPDGHTFTINRKIAINRLNAGCEISTKLLPISSQISTYEIELRNFIDSLGVSYYINDRKIIKPKEIDIYIPSKKIGIEFNGLYWHSEYFVENDYHKNKHKLAKKNNIELIQIFEDEWILKKNVVKSIIKNRLGFVNKKHFARKCKIKEVNSSIVNEFLNKNHIQGYVASKINIALYHNDEIVSVMTFGPQRKSLGARKKKNSYEMLRFCNKTNLLVVGGASKLFKYFLKKYDVNEVVTYADIRYFNGGSYEKMGFTYHSITKPNYWYVFKDTITKKHRFNFRKDVLVKQGFDKTKTAHQIMLERKIPRIYDCGNHKYIYKTNPQQK